MKNILVASYPTIKITKGGSVKGENITLEKVLKRIKNGFVASQINKMRELGKLENKAAYNKIKNNLPAVCYSSTTDDGYRGIDSNTQNNILAFEIDLDNTFKYDENVNKATLKLAIEKLKKEVFAFLGCNAVFYSPSKLGLTLLWRVDDSPKMKKQEITTVFNVFYKYIEESIKPSVCREVAKAFRIPENAKLCPFTLDKAVLSSVDRGFYMTYDPEMEVDFEKETHFSKGIDVFFERVRNDPKYGNAVFNEKAGNVQVKNTKFAQIQNISLDDFKVGNYRISQTAFKEAVMRNIYGVHAVNESRHKRLFNSVLAANREGFTFDEFCFLMENTIIPYDNSLRVGQGYANIEEAYYRDLEGGALLRAYTKYDDFGANARSYMSEKLQADTIEYIREGLYLSDVIKPENTQGWVILDASTGLGKTTWCAGLRNTIILAPTTGLVLEYGAKGMKMYHSRCKNAEFGDSNIVCTVQSYENMLKSWGKTHQEVGEFYRIVLDETQNLITMPEAIVEAQMDFLEQIEHYPNVILLSGTLPYFCNPVLSDFRILSYKRENEPEVPFVTVQTETVISEELIKQSLLAKVNGYLSFVFLRSKGGELDSFLSKASVLGLNTLILNADEKGTGSYNSVYSTGVIPQNIDVVIHTDSFKEGTSITKIAQKGAVFVTAEPLEAKEYKQWVNRLRDFNLERKVVRVLSKNWKPSKGCYKMEVLAKLFEKEAQSMCDFLEGQVDNLKVEKGNYYVKRNELKKEVIANNVQNLRLVKTKGDKFEIDYRSIDHKLFESLTTSEHYDPILFKNEMEYWHFFEVDYSGFYKKDITEEEALMKTKEIKEKIKVEKENLENKKAEIRNEVFEECEKMTLVEIETFVDSKKNRIKADEKFALEVYQTVAPHFENKKHELAQLLREFNTTMVSNIKSNVKYIQLKKVNKNSFQVRSVDALKKWVLECNKAKFYSADELWDELHSVYFTHIAERRKVKNIDKKTLTSLRKKFFVDFLGKYVQIDKTKVGYTFSSENYLGIDFAYATDYNVRFAYDQKIINGKASPIIKKSEKAKEDTFYGKEDIEELIDLKAVFDDQEINNIFENEKENKENKENMSKEELEELQNEIEEVMNEVSYDEYESFNYTELEEEEEAEN